MAKVLILGGGFGGVVAAERLAAELSDEHQITLVSRSRHFVFYPELVRVAFGKCKPADVTFDLRQALLSKKVNFIQAEVAHINPFERRVTIAHGEVEGALPYDYLLFALGRRLATERITGFFEHAHHLLNVDKTIQFGKALDEFREGRAVFGQCVGARLPVPVYETAFALARRVKETCDRDRVKITIVSPETIESELGDIDAAVALKKVLSDHHIEVLQNFHIESVTQDSVKTNSGNVNFDLLMLIPPFRGSSAASYMRSTNEEGYINVDLSMRVIGHERIFAVGDSVNFEGPKMGHMAVRQAEVAAANLAAEIHGHEPVSHYFHEMKFVVDESGSGSIYVHKDIWENGPAVVKQGGLWSWAKRAHKGLWQFSHA
jgi:sulfide:quinone oxidoreductase